MATASSNAANDDFYLFLPFLYMLVFHISSLLFTIIESQQYSHLIQIYISRERFLMLAGLIRPAVLFQSSVISGILS